MLKGDVTSNVGGTIVFITAVLAIVFFVSTTFVRINADIITVEEKMNVVDMTHLMYKCFGNGVIDTSKLEVEKLSDLFSNEMCKRDVYVKIEDMESGQNWEFGDQGEYSHEIYVPLKNGDKVNFGRLYVSM